MSAHRSKLYGRLLGGVAAISLLTAFGAHAEDLTQFDIAPQPLSSALNEFATQSKMAVLFTPDLTGTRVSPGLSKAAEPETALAMMLQGTGLSWKRNGDTFIIMSASDPQSGSAAGDGADQGTVAALVVTAQKREEQIQDVPIAISAFTEKSLEEQKIEGGFDLLKAIPNVTFSKNNFSSYNFSIRGIGTKAISVTTDPGVAVEFNSTALIRNRLFEQEYFDVERVEVLRGPQGTLHGRNATAGVINVISAKPNPQEFSGWLKGEVGNYHAKRASAMVNVPLVEDKLAIRLAGALTDRFGYDYNTGTHHAINGRDLWSARVTLGFNPSDRIRSNLIWERFNEDDNRSRTGKQLCYRDPGLTQIGNTQLDIYYGAFFSQGCKAGSLYGDGAFGTPNGLSMPFVLIGASPPGQSGGNVIGGTPEGTNVRVMRTADPYGGMMQSRDLRVINSFRDPVYRAKTDVAELNVDFDLTSALTVTSQTAYTKDNIYSFQDYNRFNTVPIFNDSSGLTDFYNLPVNHLGNLTPGGVYCDPQLGCSKSLAGFDISQAKSSQFSQELRIQSSFSGPTNFSAGVNYTQYKTLEDYYVMFNLITLIAQTDGPLNSFNGSDDFTKCTPKPNFVGQSNFNLPPVDLSDPVASEHCIYIDPNPVEQINGEGHNYFRSKNPYRLRSAAVFGEVYWEMSEALKVTLGLRYTDDHKTFTPVPTQVLFHTGLLGFGFADRGYPALPDIKQHWGEVTGRFGLDWKPHLAFTDQTLVYAFYSRGYKGGGANPPGIGFVVDLPKAYGPTFEPEFVNAFEVGTKNTLMGGALVLNGDVFFYDYKDYQVSQIKDRTAVNENFDARVWGAELESLFALSPDTRLNMTFGYQDSRIADGERSIDLMNRTQGNPDYVVVKPFVIFPSNCVASVAFAEAHADQPGNICPIFPDPSQDAILPNSGLGFYADLGGNELPNAPHWTTSFGAQQSWNFLEGWRATVRGDAYWQSQSWARVYNAVNDKLHGWYNVNLSAWIERPEDGLKIEIYAKNILDKTPITDAFLNSDDTALTTNVFVLDPRLIGLSIKKDF